VNEKEQLEKGLEEEEEKKRFLEVNFFKDFFTFLQLR
jgi:hypothetical protein